MAKHMKRGWLWAGALAGTLALGTACSATETPVTLAQATPSTGQTGTSTGTATGVPPQDTTAPGAAGTSTGTTTAPGTTGTGMGGSGTGGTTSVTGTDAGVGMGGSGSGTTPGLNPNPSDSTSTFQPPTGGSVIDAGTGF
ncbi:Erp protein [Pyxidicoccus sp. MSG2]|uniref:Erp protein n=1 Tax=Pyxidicoccus sp. MSG2 TaxID=2996790 RepID=UPI00226F994F|nr:Erp protein [Pyxidicoccus sp. MSG2]MCY1017561.1 Erp protein [Pyxidicoccus sp. MSG2]